MTPSPQFVALAESLLPCSCPNGGDPIAFRRHEDECPSSRCPAIATALESQFNAGLEKGATRMDYYADAVTEKGDDGATYEFAAKQIRALKTPAGKQEEG